MLSTSVLLHVAVLFHLLYKMCDSEHHCHGALYYDVTELKTLLYNCPTHAAVIKFCAMMLQNCKGLLYHLLTQTAVI